MLSGQRGPGVQRRFNGCNDERLKLEHGDPVSRCDRGEGTGAGEPGEGSGGRRQMDFAGQVRDGGGWKEARKQEERGSRREGEAAY